MWLGSSAPPRAIQARTSSPRPGGITTRARNDQNRSTMIASPAADSSNSGIIGQPPAFTSSSTQVSPRLNSGG
jgi:hypothetical protein